MRTFSDLIHHGRILCDLAGQVETRHLMSAAGCVQALVTLFNGDVFMDGKDNDQNFLTRQHSVVALADLSECQECQEDIITSGIIPHLVDLVVDGPYYSAGMRRDCARILANIAERKPEQIIIDVGRGRIESWFDTVDKLADARLKPSAERACNLLRDAITI